MISKEILNTFDTPSELIKKYNLLAKKSLGQHFLLDQNLTDRICRLTPDLKEATVVEIGPGPGGLTRSILKQEVSKLILIEQDERFVNIFSQLGEGIEVIHKDALEVSMASISDEKLKVISNLPYNISTPLLINWLYEAAHIDSMTLMFQKEVADRIIAEPRTKAYGRLSILSQWRCEIKKLFDITPKAFVPPPKVVSTVLHFKPRPINELKDIEIKKLELIAKHAFQQRRKTLRKSLSQLKFHEVVHSEIDFSKRPEELSIEEFGQLSKRLV